MFWHVLSFLFSTLFPATRRKVKKSTRRSHCDAYTRQIVKISKKHQTTEMLPNHVLTCSQLLVFTFNSNNHKKSEKSTRRSHYDAYTRQIVKTSALPPNNRNAFQTMFWHVLSFLFSTLIPATRRKVKKKYPSEPLWCIYTANCED